jgi:hypothetical protein
MPALASDVPLICKGLVVLNPADGEMIAGAGGTVVPVTAALAFLLIADVEGPRNGLVRVQPVNLDDLAAAMREK